MSASKVIGIVLIVAGVAGLLYDRYGYTRETQEAQLGPLQLSITEKKAAEFPLWLGLGAIALGIVLIVIDRKK